MSERLRLWPIPPRFGSGAQSPDRSAIFADVAWLAGAACCGAAGVCATRETQKVITGARASAAVLERFCMRRLLFWLAVRGWCRSSRWTGLQFFAVRQDDLLYIPDGSTAFGREHVHRH